MVRRHFSSARLRFLNFVGLVTNDEGDNYIVATEANTLELIRYSLSDGRTKEFHEALATAYEAHRGDIDAIREALERGNQSHKAIEYAWHAADQAEGDGDHMRASALLSVCLENTDDDEQIAKTLRRLADSLGRQGQYRAAWQALERLRETVPDEDTRIRAKCCQYALLCGDLDGFEDNFIKLPRAARPALASLLVAYLPHRTMEFVEGDESAEAHLAKAATAAHDLSDKAVRDGLSLLDQLAHTLTANEPEVLVPMAMIRGQLNSVQGKFPEAREIFNAINEAHFARITEPHRFKPNYDLALAEVYHESGDYLAARSLARNVDRYSRQFGRLGLSTRAGILLAHLNFACEDSVDVHDAQRLRRDWHPRVYSSSTPPRFVGYLA